VKASYALLALAIVAGPVLTTGVAAGDGTGQIPADLQVYDAQSGASPLAIISKVPAETDGGLMYAQSHVEIGKSIGSAAAGTLGPLGDAFVLTSVPIPGFAIPAQVTAQFPPSAFAPTHANSSTNLGLGPATLATFTATATDPTAASADAIGGEGGQAGVLHIGGATSHSQSAVMPDGTVVTSAVSSLHDVIVGSNIAPTLSISAMTSTATVSVPLGGKPSSSVKVEMAGALLGGVPIDINQSGITLAGSLAVPATSVATINTALKMLAAQGLVIQAVPVVNATSDVGATVSGAALEIGYVVPASIAGQLPTNIGTNETILLGEVAATATGRKRVPLAVAPPPALGTLPGLNPVSTPSPVATPVAAPAATPAPTEAVAAPAVSKPATTGSLFALPHRVQNTASKRFLDGYTMFIVAALVMAGVYLLTRRSTRLA
jgi:hypothetical protein